MTKAGPIAEKGARLSVTAHPDDNVATLFDDNRQRTRIAGNLAIAPHIPFGHKVALAPIPAGGAVIKYGVVIGHAKSAIAQGDHVHVHNIA